MPCKLDNSPTSNRFDHWIELENKADIVPTTKQDFSTLWQAFSRGDVKTLPLPPQWWSIFERNLMRLCEGISPLGYWWKVNQPPTQTKASNTLPPFEQRDSWNPEIIKELRSRHVRPHTITQRLYKNFGASTYGPTRRPRIRRPRIPLFKRGGECYKAYFG